MGFAAAQVTRDEDVGAQRGIVCGHAHGLEKRLRATARGLFGNQDLVGLGNEEVLEHRVASHRADKKIQPIQSLRACHFAITTPNIG